MGNAGAPGAPLTRSARIFLEVMVMPQEVTRQQVRRQVGLFLLLFGLLLALLGAKPEWFALSLAPTTVGFLQLLTFLTGLGFIAFGLYLRLLAAWNANGELPVRADLGMRVAATGYILVSIAALADILGLGSHPNPKEAYFGPWQYTGMLLGLGMMVLGYIAAWPWERWMRAKDGQDE